MKQQAALPAGDGWVGVSAPSRLHFGLLALPDAAHSTHWADSTGQFTIPRRQFGGAGLMIEAPRLLLSARRATEWSASGPDADRALEKAKLCAREIAAWQRLPEAVGPCEIVIQRTVRAHVGLGSGTQLALALVQALLELYSLEKVDAGCLARLGHRGGRSAIGVHGFLQGGFLVDAGKSSCEPVGTLIARANFPAKWKIVIAVPEAVEGLHGLEELGAFGYLGVRELDLARTDAMCRLLLLGMLPAIETMDLEAFSEALHDYNRRAGEMYGALQGGPFAEPFNAAVVGFLRQQGITGVGQSSWGPATFAVVEEERAAWLQQALCKRFALEPRQVVCTLADNQGRVVLGRNSSGY
jgi:beta-ribofuranosylaminobenzene 5'-phosphate synthase